MTTIGLMGFDRTGGFSGIGTAELVLVVW